MGNSLYGPLSSGGDIHSARVKKQDTPATYNKLADEHTYDVHEETYGLSRRSANPALASMTTMSSNPAEHAMMSGHQTANPAMSMAKPKKPTTPQKGNY